MGIISIFGMFDERDFDSYHFIIGKGIFRGHLFMWKVLICVILIEKFK